MSDNKDQKTKFNVILCPVDLSANSLPAIELASTLARQHGATVNFMFVATQWVTDDAMIGSEYIQEIVRQDKEAFLRLRPADPSVAFTHTYVLGNPGPEIVIASRSCDSIVMTTRGHGAFMRFLMGGVSQYVLRHADCPVILLNNFKVEPKPSGSDRSGLVFVTDVMQYVRPIEGFEKMDDVLVELDKAGETAAPVVTLGGECIGILTKTDIERFQQLRQRYNERDPSVVDEIFEVDKFGHRRVSKRDFDQVKRHMTCPIVTISNTADVQAAKELFTAHPEIHHLVVVDDKDRPLGILDTKTVSPDSHSDLERGLHSTDVVNIADDQ